MTRVSAAVIALFLLSAAPARVETVTFDAMQLNRPPDGFATALTGGGKAPVWVVRPAPDTASGRAVMQTSAEAIDNRFPLLVRDGVKAQDVELSVRFQAVSGKIDQAAGLVWRYRDANNYYLVRANALEDNVVAYKVEKGQRIDLPVKGQGRTYGAKAPVTKGGWNTLGVGMRGTLIRVSLNGVALYEVEDGTFPDAGGIGMWTKADSVMMFDDFTWTVIK
jgi:hypothetical protein